jgi:predicted regulator of Ras-like GTPase activity (Roadblock/LC7/MglB family)
VTPEPPAARDLTWLLDDLIARVHEAQHAVVLSADGLLIASSKGLRQRDAQHLSSVASGVHSLATGTSERFNAGPVQQTVIEMRSAFLFITVAGQGARVAMLATEDADVGQIGYELAMLVTRAGDALTSPIRSATPAARTEAT